MKELLIHATWVFVPSHQCKTEAALLKSVEINACNGSVREA